MSNTVFYFAYGSNMSSARLASRLRFSRRGGIGVLTGHRLEFHMISSNDGSAKCDAFPTGLEGDVVHGVLFIIDEQELPVLDRYEGRGAAYERFEVEITRPDGLRVRAQTYRALAVGHDALPFDWYKEHVVRGAQEHGLPPAYIACLEAVADEPDPDQQRRERELAIYAPGRNAG